MNLILSRLERYLLQCFRNMQECEEKPQVLMDKSMDRSMFDGMVQSQVVPSGFDSQPSGFDNGLHDLNSKLDRI
jgi:hypothetical protein